MTRMYVRRLEIAEREPSFRKKLARNFHHVGGPIVYLMVWPNIVIVLHCFIVLYRCDHELAMSEGWFRFYLKAWEAALAGFQPKNESSSVPRPTASPIEYEKEVNVSQNEEQACSAPFTRPLEKHLEMVGDTRIWIFIAIFSLWALLSQGLLGGDEYKGQPTKFGYVPIYRRSGVRYYVVTVILAALAIGFDTFTAYTVYRMLPAVTGVLNTYAFIISIMLYLKGGLHPSPGAGSGTSGSQIFDFYWGLELHPRMLFDKIDIKMAIYSRFSMMLWQLIVLLCWKAEIEQRNCNWTMTCTTAIQSIYIAKFFLWEDGYVRGIDITMDKTGFYNVWLHVCLKPTFHSIASVYLTENVPDVAYPWSVFTLVIGLTGLCLVGLNFWVDYQKQKTRDLHGAIVIWGALPRLLFVSTRLSSGSSVENILLASGWWGLSRHMNYLFEILAAITWTLPAIMCPVSSSWVPFLYPTYLIFFLLHRSWRDDRKCRKRYHKHWQDYCTLVPYKIIPGIY